MNLRDNLCHPLIATMSIYLYGDEVRSRGVPRDDLLPGLRLAHYRGRAVMVYRVTNATVAVLGICYDGQDYAARFQPDPED